jgi:hypothetical protein
MEDLIRDEWARIAPARSGVDRRQGERRRAHQVVAVERRADEERRSGYDRRLDIRLILQRADASLLAAAQSERFDELAEAHAFPDDGPEFPRGVYHSSHDALAVLR